MASNNEIDKGSTAKLRLAIDLRILVVVLLLVIAGMLFIWKPWSGNATAARTIEVRGEATVTAEPDEFVFYPMYQSKSMDTGAALAELTKKSDELVKKLKELGVAEKNIKTNSSSFEGYAKMRPEPDTSSYSLQLTVTVGNLELAQKVQDYLVTTQPTGAISPLANFSDSKRKTLENEARTKAVTDAKSKADQSARQLGFKVAKVKTVSDGTGFSLLQMSGREGATGMATDSKASLGVHPGENELPYSVTVVYFIR